VRLHRLTRHYAAFTWEPCRMPDGTVCAQPLAGRALMPHAGTNAWPGRGRARCGRAGCRSVCQTNSSLLSECVTTRSGCPGTSRILFTCRVGAHAARTAAAPARSVSRAAQNVRPVFCGRGGGAVAARLAGVQDRLVDLDVRRGLGVREVENGLRRRHAPLQRPTGPHEARKSSRKSSRHFLWWSGCLRRWQKVRAGLSALCSWRSAALQRSGWAPHGAGPGRGRRPGLSMACHSSCMRS